MRAIFLSLIFITFSLWGQGQNTLSLQVGDKLVYEVTGKKTLIWEFTALSIGDSIRFKFIQTGVVNDSGIITISTANRLSAPLLIFYAMPNKNCSACTYMMLSKKVFDQIMTKNASFQCDGTFEGITIKDLSRETYSLKDKGQEKSYKAIKVKSILNHGEELTFSDNRDFPIVLSFIGNFTIRLKEIVRK